MLGALHVCASTSHSQYNTRREKKTIPSTGSPTTTFVAAVSISIITLTRSGLIQFLADEATRRMDDITSKLRTDRVKQEERKKDKEVKLTDRLPPAKRQRCQSSSLSYCGRRRSYIYITGGQTQPKTLFQRTRTEASRVSKTTYQARMFPNAQKIVPNSLASRVPILAPPCAPGPSRSTQPSVAVTVTVVRRPNRETSSATSAASTVSAASSSSGLSSPRTRLSASPRALPVFKDLRVASPSNHALGTVHTTSASSVRPSPVERRSSSTVHSSAPPRGECTPTQRANPAPVATLSSAPMPSSAAPVVAKSVPFPNPTPPSGLPSASSPPPGQPLKAKSKDPMSLLFMPKRRVAPLVVLSPSRAR
jgi:hypothetical protein